MNPTTPNILTRARAGARNRGGARPYRGPRRGGFTLIEVLVTLVLLSIIIPVAMMATTQALRMTDTAKQRSTASALAESQLALLISSGDWQNGGATDGDCGPDYPGFYWHADINNWTEANLEELDMKVYWGSSPNDPATSVTLSTLAYVSNADAAAATGSTGGTQ